MKRNKIITTALALIVTAAMIPSATLKADAAGFDPKSVGGTGSNSIPAWKEINEDVAGWIRVPGTNINWPVVFEEKNNKTYIDLDYFGNKNKNGVIYADGWTKFGDKKTMSKNTVLYGHNWKNISANPRVTDPGDVMFEQLASYHHLDFAKKTPYIHFSTEEANMTWKVFAAFYTETKFNYIESDPKDETFKQIIETAKKKSLHNFDVDVNEKDKIITLSTCTRAYGSTDKQRFVVMARLMRDGEKIEEVNVTENKNFERPKL